MKFEQEQTLPIPRLQGDSIVLRPCIPDDFEAIKTYRQELEGCRYIRPPESDKKIQEIVEQHCSPWKLEVGRWNGLILSWNGESSWKGENSFNGKSSPNGESKAIGEIVFKIEDWDNQRAEIGYRVSADCAGKGVCSQAVKLIVTYLFEQIELHKIVAKCDPRNIASFKIMEKIGMEREGYFKEHYLNGDEWTDQLDYGLLRKDWITRK